MRSVCECIFLYLNAYFVGPPQRTNRLRLFRQSLHSWLRMSAGRRPNEDLDIYICTSPLLQLLYYVSTVPFQLIRQLSHPQDAKTPDAKTPDAKTPDSKTPDAKTPDAKTPEPKTPEPRPPQDAKPPEPRYVVLPPIRIHRAN